MHLNCQKKCNFQQETPLSSMYYLPVYNSEGINTNFTNNIPNKKLVCKTCGQQFKETVTFNESTLLKIKPDPN